MRIALIAETFLPDVNGIVTTLRYVLEHLQSAGHQALLFAPAGAPAHYAGAEVVALPGLPFPLYPELRLTPPPLGMLARLRRFKPDLLHLVGPFTLGQTGHSLARRLNLPLLASYHTDVPAYSAYYGLGWLRAAAYRYLRWVHNRCTLTLCPSSATLADLRAHGFERLHVWGRGVDSARFHPAQQSLAWRDSVGARADETVLLYVGRLAREKRIDLLADALDGMAGVRLVLVGDGPVRPALARQLAHRPVVFSGLLHGDALARAYASADLFVCPSDTETFGQATQEAMAAGLPVVAARAGGARDLVQDEATGLLFTPGDAHDLRRCLQALVDSPTRRAALGQAARTRAEQRSWRAVVDELIGWYGQAQRDAVERQQQGRLPHTRAKLLS
jgi:phosphatidylinositol alpha 1,6-mannosyltransferase